MTIFKPVLRKTETPNLILGVCILLHVWDQDEGGFPPTQH
jgi:hypothetical protein